MLQWDEPLIQYDWYPYVKWTFGDRHAYGKMQSEHEGRIWGDVSISQGQLHECAVCTGPHVQNGLTLNLMLFC